MAQPAAVLSILVHANTSNATRGLVRFNTQLGATESSANKALGAVKTMAKGAALGAGVGLGYAVKKAADFEQQLDSLGSVSGATGRQMEQLRKQAMKAGADTKFSALDAAQAQTELAKGGLEVRNIMRGGLKSALALAAAGEMELADAASTTSNAMNLFGLKGKDAMKVADQLATAANATTADVGDFALALKMGGSVAKMAGLSFGETVLSLEALAKVGIQGSDAGTSLKTAIIQLLKPTAKQKELADKLNLSFVDQQGHMKSMSDISAMLRDKLGGMTDAQRIATLATLAGTDGVRTLSSLYDAGPAKLDKWAKGLDKSGTAAKVAADKQDNLKGKLENLQGSIETTAIALGSKMLPALTDAAEKITDVINDPKLSGAEKFDKLGEMAADAMGKAGPVVGAAAAKLGLVALRGFFNAFRESPLWLKLVTAGFLFKKFGGFQAFRKTGTAAGAAMGSAIATSATATAATGMSTAKGTAVWAGWGKQTGAATGATMATATATSFSGRMKGRMYGIGKAVVGAALIAGATDAITRQGISGFGDRFQQFASTASLGLLPPPKDIQERLGKIAQQIQQWRSAGLLKLSDPNDPDNSLIRQKDLGDFTHRQRKMLAGMAELRNTASKFFGPGQHLISQAWANPERAQKQLRSLMNEFGRMRSGAVLNVKDLRQVTSSNFKAIAETMGVNSKRGKEAVQQNFNLGLRIIKGFVKDGTLTTAQGAKEIARLLKVHSGAGKESVKTNFFAARKAIAKAMGGSVRITDKGAAAIREIFAQELRLYGFSKESIKFRLQGKDFTGKNVGAGSEGNLAIGQKGLIVRGGKPVGDSVHAMLERGEVVVNRKAVQRLGGPEKVNQLNRMLPRFQAGGIAGMTAAANKLDRAQFPYVWGGGHQGSPAPFGPMDCSGAVSFVLQHGGVKIPTMVSGALAGAGSPGPGKVTVFANPVHTFMRIGNRYFGTSGSNPGGGAGWMPDPGAGYRGGFAQRHFKAGGGLGIPKLTVGPDSPLASVATGALAGVRSAAKTKLDQLLSSTIGGGDVGDPGPGFSKGQLMRLWLRANGQLGDPSLMAAIALAESGGDPNAHNPSGASGLWQILGEPFPGDVFDPMTNARMAASKLLSQGLGAWEAYTNGNYSQFLQQGGIVGMQTGGVVTGLRHTLDYLRGKGTGDIRHRKTKTLLDRIRKSGQFPKITANIAKYENVAAVAGDFADRAGQLTVDDPDGNPILGVVNGKTEVQYVQEHLEALFRLRNWMVRLHEAIAARRAMLAKALDVAFKARDRIDRRLKALRKHPKQNRLAIRRLVRTRSALTGKFIPTIKRERGDLWGTRGTNLEALDGVQGVGSPMKVFKTLPALGTLGGEILDAQVRLRELNTKPAAVTDSGTGTDAPGVAEALELSRQSFLRTATYDLQKTVFENMQQFATGGVVAGASGAVVPAVVHGGEGVFTREQMAALGAGVQVIVNGDIINTPRGKRPVEIRDVRGGSRAPLPGRGGGITRLG